MLCENQTSVQVEENKDKCWHVLIGVTGSVATIKLTSVIQAIRTKFEKEQLKLQIKVISTANAQHFFNSNDLNELQPPVQLYRDEDEWSSWKQMGDSVLHIDLRNWSDLLLIAPLDANTMAKLANGLCDNLLTCTARAWNCTKPILIAPAMNTVMWEHAHTEAHLNVLQRLGYTVIPVISKRLACGDTGLGAMATPDSIANAVFESYQTNLSHS